MVRIQFLGAARTVTGSKFLVDTGRTRFMVDCGMFQGAKKYRLMNWEPFPVKPAGVEHVILTHAHIDHCGMLPRFVRDGFQGAVWCTPATRELAELTLNDSAHLQEEDAKFANKKKFTKHEPALPLYTLQDAERAIRQLRPVSYGAETEISKDVSFRFLDAGHILGSGIVEVSIRTDTKIIRIIFSGDLGRYDASILRDPSPIEGADYLLVESTYGDRLHPKEGTRQELSEMINQTAKRGGTLVVPAFALGRTQSLLYEIRELKSANLIADLPIYVDSPMAVDVTQIFCRHMDDFDEDAKRIFEASGQCPILCPNLHLVRNTDESKRLNSTHYPSVIISASGMATGGRILHHLALKLPDPKSTVLFIGFQADGTRGQLLKNGAKEIKIHGIQVPVRAEIRSMESFSAHADSSEILRWLRTFKQTPKRTFIVHGEPSGSEALGATIRQTLNWQTHVPDYLESIDLD